MSDIPTKADVEAEMAYEAMIEEIDHYFGGEIPPRWLKLMDDPDSNKLGYEWYRFRHPDG